jgi:hypothetical protein
MKWYDNFEEYMKMGKNNVWKIPLELFKIMLENWDPRAEEPEIIITLTDNSGNVVDIEKFKLWIRGYNHIGRISWCEDIPPKIWP